MAERLQFKSDEMSYESMLAAEHLSRYWLVRDFCKGKRVLDLACGEGYGSWLLKKWGAETVIGIDISEEAISNSNQNFGGDGIFFKSGDGCDLDRTLNANDKFDLIVCFETMEHVPDVAKLLQGFKSHLMPNGSIVISCPNDPGISEETPNPFHLRTYTFEQFQDIVVSILGPATSWMIGTPVIGFTVCPAQADVLDAGHQSMDSMLKGADIENAHLLPAQRGHEVVTSAAHFFIGVWGAPLPTVAIAAPIAFTTYEGPWRGWVAARDALEALQTTHAELLVKQAVLHGDLTQLRLENASILDVGRLEQHRLQGQLADCRRAGLVAWEKLRMERESAAQKLEAVQKSSEASEQKLEAVQKSAEEALCAAQKSSEEALCVAQRSSEEALRGARKSYDQMLAAAQNQFAQQLLAAAESSAAIQLENQRLAQELAEVKRSRFYRLAKKYYRSFESESTRWFMRPARYVARGAYRIFRKG